MGKETPIPDDGSVSDDSMRIIKEENAKNPQPYKKPEARPLNEPEAYREDDWKERYTRRQKSRTDI